MHELAVTQSVLDIALQYAEQSGASRITDLYLVIGDLASIVDDSVCFYWDILSKGTIAEGAHLHFERVAPRLECLDCKVDYQPEPGTLLCPRCGGTHVRVIRGDEFTLQAIEIEA